MPQAIWTGSIAFGLVNVPVKLFAATRPRDVRFHQFQRGTNRRIRYARVTEEAPAAWEPETTRYDEIEVPRALRDRSAASTGI